MPEPLNLPSWDRLDLLVDTDPIELRNEAWRMRSETERLATQVTDLTGRYDAQKARADKAAARHRAVARAALLRFNELSQLRDAVRDSDPARAERLAFAAQEIRDLFKKAGGEADV